MTTTSEATNSIRQKLLEITTLMREIHEILLNLELKADIEDVNANQTQSPQ